MSTAPNAPPDGPRRGPVPGQPAAPIRACRNGCAFSPDGIVEVTPGKVEIGQGILTALAQIAADELDVELARVAHRPGDDRAQPERGRDLGQPLGPGLRRRAAPRLRRGARASSSPPRRERLGVPAERARASRTAPSPGPATRARATGSLPTRSRSTATPPAAPRRSRPPRAASPARPRPRLDIPDKVFGAPRFIHDLSLPGMLHGRVLRPRRAAARRWRRSTTRPRAACRASSRWSGTAASSASSPRPSTPRTRRSRASPPARAGRRARRCRTRRARGLAQEPAGRDARSSTARGRTRPARPRADAAARLHAGPSRACLDRALLRRRAVERRDGCMSGRTARASTICAPTSRSCWRCRRSGSSSSMSRAPAATATTAPTTSRSTRCSSPAPRRGGRCACSGRAPTSWPASPFGAAHARSRSRPISTPRGEIVGWRHDIWSNGHVARPGPQRSPTLLAASSSQSPFPRFIAINPPLAAGGGADRNARAALRLSRAWRDHQPPPARDAAADLGAALARRLRECLRDRVASSTSSRPSAARTRWRSACAI